MEKKYYRMIPTLISRFNLDIRDFCIQILTHKFDSRTTYNAAVAASYKTLYYQSNNQ